MTQRHLPSVDRFLVVQAVGGSLFVSGRFGDAELPWGVGSQSSDGWEPCLVTNPHAGWRCPDEWLEENTFNLFQLGGS